MHKLSTPPPPAPPPPVPSQFPFCAPCSEKQALKELSTKKIGFDKAAFIKTSHDLLPLLCQAWDVQWALIEAALASLAAAAAGGGGAEGVGGGGVGGVGGVAAVGAEAAGAVAVGTVCVKVRFDSRIFGDFLFPKYRCFFVVLEK